MEPFVVVEGLKKTFYTRTGPVEVLRGVDLSVEKGDIYGIIGFSGAGKSTMIRLINRLEKPDEGRVTIGGTDVTALGKEALVLKRQKIGMIFQQFNLFDARTVFGNVAYPLEVAGIAKRHIRPRVEQILELVELTDKIDCYPGQLSGGQKQRVGIARALANQPEVLLSDEATSALDPKTTLSILDLLKDINARLGLTIILITHELEVIRYACNHMAVLEDGKIVESGSTQAVFENPASQTSRLFMKIHSEFVSDRWLKGGDGI
jgi:D-methionine transport system ATP-binding protein